MPKSKMEMMKEKASKMVEDSPEDEKSEGEAPEAPEMEMPEEMDDMEEAGSMDSDYVDECMKCLMRAEDIKRRPELMKLIAAHAEKHKGTIKSIADLKKAYEKPDALEEDSKLIKAKA